MKRCSHCGENYDDRVDFCFGDGTPLDAVLKPQAAAQSKSAQSESFMAGLDAPDAENISGLDAPDPGGFSFDPPEPESAPVPVVTEPMPKRFEASVPQPEPPKQVERQSQESGQIPVGFFEPPSQVESVDASTDESDSVEHDDLGFPEGFGDPPFGGDFDGDFDGGFGEDFTDPTMPAPTTRKRPVFLMAFATAFIGAAFAVKLTMGGSEPVEPEIQAKVEQPIAQPVKPAAVPTPTPEPIVEEEPEEEEPEEGAGESEEVSAEVEPDRVELVEEKPAAPAIVKEPKRPVVPKVSAVVSPEPKKPAAEVPSADAEASPWGAVVAKAPSLVRIYSKPAGAVVFVDGRQRGSTPAEVELDSGVHSIRVEKDGFFSESRDLDVRKPSHLERFKLNPRDQRVTVNCYGPDASKVYLDGQVICAIPGSGTLKAGRHTFRVVTPDRFFKMVVDVQARPDGSPTPLRFTD